MATARAKEQAADTRRANKKTIDSMYMGPEPVFSKGDVPEDTKTQDRMWAKAANWYNYYYAPKDYVPYVLKYGIDVLGWTKDQARRVKSLKDFEISMTIGPGKACVIWARGFEYNKSWKKKIKDRMKALLALAMSREEEIEEQDTKPKVTPISPSVRTRAKMMDTIYGDFDDHIIEGWIEGDFKRKLDVYGLCKKYDIKGAGVNMFQTRIQEFLDEYNDAYNKTCEQAVEGYSHIKRTDQKKAINQLQAIINDCDALKQSAKAARLPRAKKPKASDKQVEKMQYMKDHIESKLTSINPIMIPTAFRLYVYNTKQKKLFEYVTNSTKGFEVKGTTLQNFDDKLSRCTTLRKPDDILPGILKKTPKQIDNIWSSLTTKTGPCNGRINKDCILLRVMEK
jgi:hypothetical protein